MAGLVLDLYPFVQAWVYFKGKSRRKWSINVTLQIVYKKLTKAFAELEENHMAVLSSICRVRGKSQSCAREVRKVHKNSKNSCMMILVKKKINNNNDSHDDDSQESDYNDNSATNSKDLPFN
jgi:hypothetical protein